MQLSATVADLGSLAEVIAIHDSGKVRGEFLAASMLLSLMGSYVDLFRGRALLLGLGLKAGEGEEGAEATLLESFVIEPVAVLIEAKNLDAVFAAVK